MPFMVPEYTNEPFSRIEDQHGESYLVPSEYESDRAADATVADRYSGKWFAHLTAPGYLDQTDWDGPFDTVEEAKRHVEETFEVDPDSGEELGEE